MSVIRSLGAGIQTPAVGAVIPQLVPSDQLMRYNGINSMMQSIVQFAAPAAAGVVFSLSALPSTLMIDVITAMLGVGLFSCLSLPKHEIRQEKTSLLMDLKIGLSYSFSHKLIGRLLIMYGLFVFLSVPAGFLASLHVRRIFGDTYWYLAAVELVGFAGMVIGGLVMSLWGRFKKPVKALLLSFAAFGVFAMGMGLSKSFILYLSLMLFYGVAMTMIQTAITTLLQENSEARMQGRVLGLLSSMYSGFLPIGMMVFGPLADVFQLQSLMVGSGVMLIMIAVGLRSSRHFCEST